MSDKTDMINTAGAWILGLSLLGGIAFAFGSCVHRDWAFENACRKAGGYIAYSSSVSASGSNGKEVCAKIVQSPIATPIELPGYAP